MTDAFYNDPEWKQFARDVNARLLPIIQDSSMTVSLVPEDGSADIKFAVELGLSIMFDKPIVAVVAPGTKVPDHLVRVADRIIEADFRNKAGSADAMQRVAKEIAEMAKEIDGKSAQS